MRKWVISSETCVVSFFILYIISTFISMAAMSVGSVFLLVGALVFFQGPKGLYKAFASSLENLLVKKYFLITLALAAVCVMSLVYAQINPLTYNGESLQIHWPKDILKLWYLFLPILSFLLLKNLPEEKQKKVIRFWFYTFLVLSILSIYQYYTGWPRPRMVPRPTPLFFRYQATLFLGHHLSVASIWIFPFFVSLDFLFKPSYCAWIRLPRFFFLLTTVFGFATLMLTYSRTLWAVLPVGILIWVFMRLPKKWALIFSTFFFVGTFFIFQSPIVQNRIKSLYGISQRVEIWKMNLEFFESRPWLGIGWLKSGPASSLYVREKYENVAGHFVGHAHNNFLEMLSGTGILGTVSWMVWFVFVFYLSIRWFKKRRKKPPFVLGIFAAWIVFHLNGLTQVNFWESKVIHQVMWVVTLLLWVNTKISYEKKDFS